VRAKTAAALLCAGLVGCSTAPRPGGSTSATRYVQAAAWTAPPETSRLADLVRAALGDAGARLVLDPALTETAASIARRVATDPAHRPPSARLVQGLAWQVGLTDPIPSIVTVHRGGDGALGDETAAGLREIATQDHPTHVGVAEVARGDERWIVIALSRRRLRLGPVARQLARGERLVLEGSIEAGLRAPTLSLAHPDGRVEDQPLGEGPDFLARVPLDAPGAWQVEVEATGPEGSTVLANFPVYVDTPAPTAPEDGVPEQVGDPAEVEAALLRLTNEARAREHVAPLTLHPPLTEAARAHCQDMADHHFVAHNSPSRGTTSERLQRAGLRSGLTLENVARGYGPREIFDGLMASPGHRANILNPDVTHVGIGVVADPAGNGLLVTQDFVAVATAIDTVAAAQSLLRAVNLARRGRGLAPLDERPTLTTAAREAAAAFFREPSRTQQQALQDASARVQREGLLYRRISVAAAFGPRIDGAERLEPLLDDASRFIGVGVAQGDRPDSPANSVFVVYVLAVPR
jgi:uncharacterized protein YkwD